MATPKTLKFGNFKVWVEDPDTTAAYVAPCGFTSKSLNLSAEFNSQIIPDCDDPDAPIWSSKELTSRSASVNGSGVLATDHYAVWRNYWLQDTSFPVRVEVAATLANGGGWWAGNAVLSNITHTANLGARTEVSVALESDGPWTWVPAAA